MPERVLTAFLLLSLLFLAACGEEPAPTRVPEATVPGVAPSPVATADEAVQPPATPSEATATAVPSPTPLPPLAAMVNDQPILLSRYEKDLARYEQAQLELGMVPGADGMDYRSLVLNTLIEQELMRQAAEANDVTVTPAEIDAKLAELRELSGGAQNFEAWLQANQWTESEFREALEAEMLTERMVNIVTAEVPHTVEQVRARYLQVDDAALAQSLLEQIRAGADFALLAQTHSLDRVTGQNGGDLGYFARGSLLVPEVEEAAFGLAVGETSEIITVTHADGRTTHYLVQTIERDPQRPLDADTRFTLLQERFEAWLAELWAQANVVRHVDLDA